MKRAREEEPRTSAEHLRFEREHQVQIGRRIREREAAVRRAREEDRVLKIEELTAQNEHLVAENRISRCAELESEVLRDENLRLSEQLSETGLVEKCIGLEDELAHTHEKLSKVFGVLGRRQRKNVSEACAHTGSAQDIQREVDEENENLDVIYAPGRRNN
jgi:hypothetical protein